MPRINHLSLKTLSDYYYFFFLVGTCIQPLRIAIRNAKIMNNYIRGHKAGNFFGK